MMILYANKIFPIEKQLILIKSLRESVFFWTQSYYDYNWEYNSSLYFFHKSMLTTWRRSSYGVPTG